MSLSSGVICIRSSKMRSRPGAACPQRSVPPSAACQPAGRSVPASRAQPGRSVPASQAQQREALDVRRPGNRGGSSRSIRLSDYLCVAGSQPSASKQVIIFCCYCILMSQKFVHCAIYPRRSGVRSDSFPPDTT
ncbi:hypothetical protein T492DRAFT_964170 [Pavlovales sp. CCMP2436]|nr:hypothetical protein T492DRAFT_964170 [Pavlovales sp. CCMP2436]